MGMVIAGTLDFQCSLLDFTIRITIISRSWNPNMRLVVLRTSIRCLFLGRCLYRLLKAAPFHQFLCLLFIYNKSSPICQPILGWSKPISDYRIPLFQWWSVFVHRNSYRFTWSRLMRRDSENLSQRKLGTSSSITELDARFSFWSWASRFATWVKSVWCGKWPFTNMKNEQWMRKDETLFGKWAYSYR